MYPTPDQAEAAVLVHNLLRFIVGWSREAEGIALSELRNRDFSGQFDANEHKFMRAAIEFIESRQQETRT